MTDQATDPAAANAAGAGEATSQQAATPGASPSATGARPDAASGATSELEAKLEQARNEAIAERKRRQEFEAKVKEFEDAKLSESERTTKALAESEARRTDLERQLQEMRVRAAIERKAGTAGIVDPEAAYRLLDHSALEYEDDGQPTAKSLEQAVAALVRDRPYLVGQQAGAGGQRTSVMAPGRSAGAAGGTFTASQLADREFYLAHRAEIEAAMREGRVVPD